jgi:hypothetical protein
MRRHTGHYLGLFRFFLPCLVLGLLLWSFASPNALPKAEARGFSVGVGTGWHSGRHYGWPHGYYRGWGHGPRYYNQALFGVPLDPRYYYEPAPAPRPSPPADASQADTAHKPPLAHTYQDIAPNLRSLFEPAATASAQKAVTASTQSAAPPDPHEHYIVYPVRGRESREAWARAERWYLGDVLGDAPGLLTR